MKAELQTKYSDIPKVQFQGQVSYGCYRPNGYLSRNLSGWPKSHRPYGSRDEEHLDRIYEKQIYLYDHYDILISLQLFLKMHFSVWPVFLGELMLDKKNILQLTWMMNISGIQVVVLTMKINIRH